MHWADNSEAPRLNKDRAGVSTTTIGILSSFALANGKETSEYEYFQKHQRSLRTTPPGPVEVQSQGQDRDEETRLLAARRNDVF